MAHGKTISINYLVSKQSNWFKNHRDFNLLISYYNASDVLKKLRLPRKAYIILNNCRISSNKLDDYFRFFRIPKNPFFPVFLKIKSEYLNKNLKNKREKADYIRKVMNALDDDVMTYLKYFIKYEKNVNVRQLTPVWNKFFLPRSKKRAEEFKGYDRNRWINFFFEFIRFFNHYYNWVDKKYGEKLVALFILHLDIAKHNDDRIKSQFRILSKKYHPDAGGDNASFNNLMIAKKIMQEL